MKYLQKGVTNDVMLLPSPFFLVVGLLCVIAVGCGLIFLIVLAVKFLIRISKTTKDEEK
jgi:heme/copper-type cytochrome/quinol oxidase subunit 3